jgi:nicotinamide riboside kinase
VEDMSTETPDSSKKYHLSRNVYIIGPQSVGKTTLVNAVAGKLGGEVAIIQEVARNVMREKGYSRIDVDSGDSERKFDMQHDIFKAQVEKELALLKVGTNFLSDRSAIDPIIYLKHYSGDEGANRITSTDHWQKVRDRYSDPNSSLIVLLSPVEEFLVDDSIRYIARSLDDWHALASSFRSFLWEQKIPFVEIGKECKLIDERVACLMTRLSLGEEK